MLPFPDSMFTSIVCLDALAFVRDDAAAINELARVLAPGGTLEIRVPNQGPTAGLDAFNLFRYFSDGTRRGERPSETDELGWRRHFRKCEIAELIESAGFRVTANRTSGTGLPELGHFAAMVGFRWLRSSEEHYQRAVAVIERVREVDNRIPIPGFGFSQTILAVRE